jgi:hypothetical protein
MYSAARQGHREFVAAIGFACMAADLHHGKYDGGDAQSVGYTPTA